MAAGKILGISAPIFLVGAYLLLKPKELKPRGQSTNQQPMISEYKSFEEPKPNRPVAFGVSLVVPILNEEQRKEFYDKMNDPSGFRVEISPSPGWSILKSYKTPSFNVTNNNNMYVQFALTETNANFNPINMNRDFAVRGYSGKYGKEVTIWFKFNKDNSTIGFIAKHQSTSKSATYSPTGATPMEVSHHYEAVRISGQ